MTGLTGFTRGGDNITGMNEPGQEVTPAQVKEMQENIRILADRVRTLEAKEDPVIEEAPQVKVPRFEQGFGIIINQTKRRVTISADELALGDSTYRPPLYPVRKGRMDVVFNEFSMRMLNDSMEWQTHTVGGGAASSLTPNSTNHCWLKIDFERVTVENIYQWHVSGLSIVVNTTGTNPSVGEGNKLPSDTTNQTAIKFAEIVTGDDFIQSISFFDIHLDPRWESGLAITPLTSSSMESLTVVTDFQVDSVGRVLQIKTRDIEAYNVGAESAWTTVHTGEGCGSGS